MSEVVAHRTKRPHAKGVLCDTSFRVAHKGRGKSLSVWVRLDKTKRPHVKEVLQGALSPATHGGGGVGKFLRVWVRLGSTNKPHAKRGTYHASVFGFQPVCGGMMS